MTQTEKAIELVNIYTEVIYPIINIEKAKQCALIAVDNMLEAINGMVSEEYGYSADAYYIEVKHEIQAL